MRHAASPYPGSLEGGSSIAVVSLIEASRLSPCLLHRVLSSGGFWFLEFGNKQGIPGQRGDDEPG